LAACGPLVLGAPVAVAETPSAVTGPAQVLAPLAVTGTGTVNDAGQPGTWHFEYVYTDIGMDFSFATMPQPVAASSDDQPVSLPLDDMATGETWRYRLVLETEAGTFAGDWVEFTTPAFVFKGRPPIPRITFASSRLHIARDHTIPIRIGCRFGTSPCSGTLVIKESDAPNAANLTRRAHMEIPVGSRVRIQLPLAHEGRRLLGKNGLFVYVVVRGLEGPGSLEATDRNLSLR
jgi:hypothetical protein